jgi:hypothetical protein
LLQLLWSMARLRPQSVSCGITATQLLCTAVAAALADLLVDEHALRRVGELSSLLAAAALLGGAGLVVDQHRHARHRAQLALHGVELARGRGSSVPAGNSGPVGVVLVDLVAEHDHQTLHALASTWRAICGTLIWPSTGWPPVIATASL